MQHVETGAQSQEFEDSILGAALLCVFWYIGQCGGRFLSQHWKYLPIPSAADVTTFAVLSALRSSVEGLAGPLASVFFLTWERSPRSTDDAQTLGTFSGPSFVAYGGMASSAFVEVLQEKVRYLVRTEMRGKLRPFGPLPWQHKRVGVERSRIVVLADMKCVDVPHVQTKVCGLDCKGVGTSMQRQKLKFGHTKKCWHDRGWHVEEGFWLRWVPALRDASMLLLLARMLRAGETAAELLYSSRILTTQRSELRQNTRERRVLAVLRGAVEKQSSEEKPDEKSLLDLDDSVPLAFERACAELIASGSPGSELWLSLASLAEGEDEDSDDFAEFRMKRETSGSSAQDVFKVDGVVLEPEHVAAGARALYRKLAPHGRLNFDKLHTVIENDIETDRLWALLQALDEESEAVKHAGKTVMERSSSMPLDGSESQSAEPKSRSRKIKKTKSSGHIDQTVGVDAFVHLVVSTYKEAARLVSTVGEHSAVFALFCSVLSLLRLSVLVVVAVGRFAPITVLQTLSWLLSSVLLAVSFAWGPVLLDILQSLVLLLHVNPFDTGDMIVFRGNYLQVQQIKLLNTVFRDLCDEEIYIRNSVLYADCEGILNIRRSGRASAAIELLIPPQSATKPNLKALTAAARRYVMAHPETWQEQVSVGVFPTSQPGAAVVVGMEAFPSQGIRLRVSATHQLSKLQVGQVRSDATQFLIELLEEATKLGVEWPSPNVGDRGFVVNS
eukprot:s3098_g5.t6